ncbi:hypothetical protein V5799_008574 [Amblyomma americanum]|uniref:Tick transposon n=1 Tax=Amblyomma americanum TaxID=6943 RepID=A0AAQ4FEB1_AMBAM
MQTGHVLRKDQDKVTREILEAFEIRESGEQYVSAPSLCLSKKDVNFLRSGENSSCEYQRRSIHGITKLYSELQET